MIPVTLYVPVHSNFAQVENIQVLIDNCQKAKIVRIFSSFNCTEMFFLTSIVHLRMEFCERQDDFFLFAIQERGHN